MLICLLLKFISNPKINTQGTFEVISGYAHSSKKFESIARHILSWGQKGDALPFCVSSHTVIKCPLCGLLSSATFFAILYFVLVIPLFKMACKYRAEVLFVFPQHKKAVVCLTEKYIYQLSFIQAWITVCLAIVKCSWIINIKCRNTHRTRLCIYWFMKCDQRLERA